jgi:hypothetical protein
VVQERSIKDGYFNIVCPMDLSKETKQKIDLTVQVAKHFNSKVYLCSPHETDEFFINTIKRNLSFAEKQFKINGIVCESKIFEEKGNFVKQTLQFSASVSADLITIINGLMNPLDSNGISIYKTGSIQPDGTVRANTDVSSFQNSLAELSLDITGNGSGSGRIVVQPAAYALDPVNNLQVLSFNMDFSVDANGTPDGIDITKKIGYLLGFKKARYAGINYFSDSLCQTYLTNYVYLCIDDFTNNSNQMFISTQAKAAIDKNTLARISFRGQSYYTLVAQDDYSIITEPRKYFGPVDIQTLQVRLLDEFGRVVDMQNVDFSFCLTFKLVYDL